VASRRSRAGLAAGAAVLSALALAALCAPWIASSPNAIDLDAVLESPSPSHWLGTDGLGRDVAARLVHGSRVSLLVGLLATAVALGVGVPLGALAGYAGRWIDAAVSRTIEGILCFPGLLLVVAVLAAAPSWLARLPDALRLAVVLGLVGWTGVARYMRAEILRLREGALVDAARATGAGHARVLVVHLLPAALAPVLVTASFAVAAAILLEASLSFLGLGVSPPTPTWGGMLAEGRTLLTRAWWLSVFPGVAVFLAVLGCNLLGEGLRERLDPRTDRP